jgi:hypothetical protein
MRTLGIFALLLLLVSCTSVTASTDSGVDADAQDAVDVQPDIGMSIPCGASFCIAPQFCCPVVGFCSDTECLTCCSPGAHDGGTDTGPEAGRRTCFDATQCNLGEDCVFAAQGCGRPGVCTTQQTCSRPLSMFCGCDGTTFIETCEGPGAPWMAMGACASDAGDAVSVDVVSDF